ncbi:MAG: hypothetical protein J6Q61_04030 [Bacteroidales bacterium]|nr:hypothetical protein [Bacteroidales bacterium]
MKKTSLLKSFIVMILILIGSAPVMAQLSEGEPYSRTIRTGNRPGAGDWGLFIGPSFSEIGQMFDYETTWRGLPLVNVKYYTNDNFELRCGIQASSLTYNMSGSYYEYDYYADEYVLKQNSISQKDSEYLFRLTPGIARHFSPTNVLDVYVGASLPFGVNGVKYINEINGQGHDSSERNSFELGVGAYIGLQCFVADLPVAIGFEYGLSAVKFFGQKYKNTITDEEGKEQVYYTTSPDYGWSTQYSELKRTKGEAGADLRFTISYFFK